MNSGSQFVMEGVKNLVIKQHVSGSYIVYFCIKVGICDHKIKQFDCFSFLFYFLEPSGHTHPGQPDGAEIKPCTS